MATDSFCVLTKQASLQLPCIHQLWESFCCGYFPRILSDVENCHMPLVTIAFTHRNGAGISYLTKMEIFENESLFYNVQNK